MPRQKKKGLDFFYLDCDIFSSASDLKPLIRRYKADGLSLYIHILCDVYSKGYFFKPDNYDDYLFELADDIGITVEKVQLILTFMADRTLLDAISLSKNTVFTSHGIQKHYAEAMKGRKHSVAEIKDEYWILTENEETELDTFYKIHSNENKSEKNTDKSEKNTDKSEIYITNKIKGNKSNNTPYIPPPGETVGGWEGKAEFMRAYPLLAAFKSPYDDSSVDYKVLLDRFAKSERLRKTYSMKWVCEHYSAIKDGLFAEEEEFSNSDWEQWNSDRRHAAEDRSDNALARATADSEYNAIYMELQSLNIQLAFAEVKDKAKAAQIAERIKELEKQGNARLKELGIDKTDFIPRYSCNICNDTGYTARGVICTACMKKYKERLNGS